VESKRGKKEEEKTTQAVIKPIPTLIQGMR
jgi:hypothetical protein